MKDRLLFHRMSSHQSSVRSPLLRLWPHGARFLRLLDLSQEEATHDSVNAAADPCLIAALFVHDDVVGQTLREHTRLHPIFPRPARQSRREHAIVLRILVARLRGADLTVIINDARHLAKKRDRIWKLFEAYSPRY